MAGEIKLNNVSIATENAGTVTINNATLGNSMVLGTNASPIANNLVFANGNGIDFGATAGSGSSSNVLDDYEFGVFTPSVAGSNSAPSGVNYSVRKGNYIKIGKIVSVRVTLYFSSITTEGTGQFYATGLPYLLANSGDDFDSYFHPVFYHLQNSVSNPIGLLRKNTNQIEFFRDAFGTGGFNSMTWESHIKSNTFCSFEFSYTTS